MRRWIAAMLALFLAASIAAGCATRQSGPDPVPTPAPAPVPPPSQPSTGSTVTIHYHRYEADYKDWDLWVWPTGKDGKGYAFAGTDDYGVISTITYEERLERVGFIVRKGGNSWTAKDVPKDRFVQLADGKAEIWVLEGEEAFSTSPGAISTQPRLKAAYLDNPRSIAVKLSHDLELAGSGAEGFRFNPPLKIDTVRENAPGEIGLIGYEFINGNRSVRFVLVPGRLGFPKETADGKAEVYISGTFNAWGGTATGAFTPQPEWRMKWSDRDGRYELERPVGDGAGQVPLKGAEFKFTHQAGAGQQWYPSANLPITGRSGKGTKAVLILLAEDADVRRDYTLEHTTLGRISVQKRGVLDDPAFRYEGNDLGHTYGPSATKFRLWAPTAQGVDLLLYDQPEGGTARAAALTADAGGTWVASLPGNLKGKYYTFRLQLGAASVEVMDPYAVGAGVNGNRALVVDLKETDPPGWEAAPRPPFRNYTDAIIYEIHLRDLSTSPNSGIRQKGKFLGFTESGTTGPGGVKTGLDHLKELGITHVHLLPAFDYASVDEKRSDQFNWGYDPKNFNVPEGSYATDPNGTARIREFKQMVQALHAAGLRVVMDVVYNHTSVGASPFEAIAPFYYYRYDASGRPSNGSGTGNETASERPMMRKYIVDSVKYWASEYKVDGFRFDLMGLHDIETMRQVRSALDEIDPSILVYGEPWTGGSTPLEGSQRLLKGNQKGLRVAVFNDNIRNAIKGDNDGIVRGFATGASLQADNIKRGVVGAIDYGPYISDFTLHPHESVNYASSHDNLTLWDKIANSNPSDSEESRARMDMLSQAITFTSQGIVFMQGGEEMLRTKGMNHNSYNSPDEINQLDWSRKQKYANVFAYYQGLIALRKAHPAFRLMTADEVRLHLRFLESLPAGTVGFTLSPNAGGDPWKHILVFYNPLKEDVNLNLPPGTWEIAALGTRIGDVLGPASGSIDVPPISMLVLYQN